MPSTGGREPRILSKIVLSEIIEPRVVEIFKVVGRELVRSGVDGMLTGGMVLTGGTASLSGICQVAEQVLGMPVRVGRPTGVGGLTELVGGPEWSTGVGLVLYGARAIAEGRSLGNTSRVSRTFRRVSNWFSEHF